MIMPQEDCRAALSRAQHIIVFTGAGASAESGIPVFRAPISPWRLGVGILISIFSCYYSIILGIFIFFLSFFFLGGGLWNGLFGVLGAILAGNKMAWKRWPKVAYILYSFFFKRVALKARPNKFHQWVASHGCIVLTSNVDGLHQQAGTPSEKIFEVHGTIHREEHGRPDIVFFGEMSKMLTGPVVNHLNFVDNDPSAVVLIVGMSGMIPTMDATINRLRNNHPTFVIDPNPNTYSERMKIPRIPMTACEFVDFIENPRFSPQNKS